MNVSLKDMHAEFVFDVEGVDPVPGVNDLDRVMMIPHTLKVVIDDGEINNCFAYGAALGRGGKVLKKQAVATFWLAGDEAVGTPEWVKQAVAQAERMVTL